MEWEIVPGVGLSGIKLGDSLFNVIRLLEGREINIKFNENNSIFIISLEEYKINLIFDKFRQLLILIDINVIENCCSFKYKNEKIMSFNFRLIYNKYFGPTFDGEFNFFENNYYLSYNGITFKFNVLEDGLTSNDKLLKHKNDINCESILIFKNSNNLLMNWFKFNEQLIVLLSKSTYSFNSLLELNEFSPPFINENKLSIDSYEFSSIDKSIVVHFLKHPKNMQNFVIKCGITSMNEIIDILGFPEDSIVKKKFKLNNLQMKKFTCGNKEFTTSRNYLPPNLVPPHSINHNNLDYLKKFNYEVLKIHNYFDYGIDIVYDLNVSKNGTNIVSKIIYHTNSIESIEFLKYNFKPLFFNDNHILGNFERFRTLVNLNLKNMFIDKKEYNINEDLSYNHVSDDKFFELVDLDDNKDESLNSDLKNWGLSTFDSCNEGAIFEVLQSNDVISSVTFY